jgi:outer membrane immunogenic protein
MGDSVMKRLLSLGVALAAAWIVPALAADLPVKTPVLPFAYWEWTGCYIGAQGGGNWGRAHNNDITFPFIGVPVTNPSNLSGGLAGGTVGCSYQSWKWVFGIEADASWTNKSGIANEIPPFNTAATFGVKERWIDTLRGRLGFKFGAQDQFLLYVTGGAAAAGVTATTCLPGVFCTSASNTMTGWTAGGGGEWAVFPSMPVPHGWVSVKVEYLYVDLGSKDFSLDPTLTTSKNVSVIDHIVRAGVNWHF